MRCASAVAAPDDILGADRASGPARRRRRRRRGRGGAPGRPEIVDLRESADDAPVIKLVNQIVAQAVEQHASDIHLSPDGRDLRVRFRVDGVLHDAMTVSRRMAGGVISRIKIMADLDIAERPMPQDGRFGLHVDGQRVDLRVVTLPSVHGEGDGHAHPGQGVGRRRTSTSSACADAERERFERRSARPTARCS